MQELASAAISEERDPCQWLYAAVLYSEEGAAIDHSIWLLAPHRELKLAYPAIQVTKRSDDWIEIYSDVYCHAVHFEDHGGEILSDNWFDLLPGIVKQLRLINPIKFEDTFFTAVTIKHFDEGG